MKTDEYGNPLFSEKDILDILMSNPNIHLQKCYIDKQINIDPILGIDDKVEFIEHVDIKLNKKEFDSICQGIWLMPEEYKNLDIAQFVLECCKCDAEIQRVGKELIMYQERGLLPLLQYLKYLVDVMRNNNLVWGVGRGSSVASFVLFLLGVHRINSLYYDLDIEEFLK